MTAIVITMPSGTKLRTSYSTVFVLVSVATPASIWSAKEREFLPNSTEFARVVKGSNKVEVLMKHHRRTGAGHFIVHLPTRTITAL